MLLDGAELEARVDHLVCPADDLDLLCPKLFVIVRLGGQHCRSGLDIVRHGGRVFLGRVAVPSGRQTRQDFYIPRHEEWPYPAPRSITPRDPLVRYSAPKTPRARRSEWCCGEALRWASARLERLGGDRVSCTAERRRTYEYCELAEKDGRVPGHGSGNRGAMSGIT